MIIVENQFMCLAILTSILNIDILIFTKTLNYYSIFGTVPCYLCKQVVSQTQVINTLLSLVNSLPLMPDHFPFTNGIELSQE